MRRIHRASLPEVHEVLVDSAALVASRSVELRLRLATRKDARVVGHVSPISS
jgi:hypothetical protein